MIASVACPLIVALSFALAAWHWAGRRIGRWVSGGAR